MRRITIRISITTANANAFTHAAPRTSRMNTPTTTHACARVHMNTNAHTHVRQLLYRGQKTEVGIIWLISTHARNVRLGITSFLGLAAAPYPIMTLDEEHLRAV